jgi:hypothetical protein
VAGRVSLCLNWILPLARLLDDMQLTGIPVQGHAQCISMTMQFAAEIYGSTNFQQRQLVTQLK